MCEKNFCPKCGKPINAETQFCGYCGNKIEEIIETDNRIEDYIAVSQNEEDERAQYINSNRHLREERQQYSNANHNAYQAKPKAGGKAYVIIFAVLVLLLGVGLGGFYYWNKNIKEIELDLTSDISKKSIEFSGYDGNGEVYIDDVSARKDIVSFEENQRVHKALQSVTWEVSPKVGLGNGDKVTITANYSDRRLESLHIKPINFEREVKVSGLEKNKDYDNERPIVVNLYDSNKYSELTYYDDEYLTDEEINHMTKDEAQKAINDIFANNNYKFKKKKWANYYSSIGKQGTISDQKVVERSLTGVELANYKKLVKYISLFR